MKKITKIYAMLLMGSITLCAVGICVYGAVAICNGRAPFGLVMMLVGGFLCKGGFQCMKEVWKK